MTCATEAELVRRISQGDRQAYRLVLDNQLPSVSRFVARMMGDITEAEDITQEVFLRLWTHAGRYDPSASKVSTWLHNIAHNLCVDHFRKHGRLVGEPELDMEGGEEPDEALFASLTSNDVKEGLMNLPERQRSAIIMCHYQGLSNKEAAEILDLSVDALESLLARGRRNLKSNLSEYAGERK